jgi:hypothetical protein
MVEIGSVTSVKQMIHTPPCIQGSNEMQLIILTCSNHVHLYDATSSSQDQTPRFAYVTSLHV